MIRGPWLARLGLLLRRIGAIAGRVSGAPDYERYVAHVRAHHPGKEPVGWDQFYRARLEERYSKPGARCC